MPNTPARPSRDTRACGHWGGRGWTRTRVVRLNTPFHGTQHATLGRSPELVRTFLVNAAEVRGEEQRRGVPALAGRPATTQDDVRASVYLRGCGAGGRPGHQPPSSLPGKPYLYPAVLAFFFFLYLDYII